MTTSPTSQPFHLRGFVDFDGRRLRDERLQRPGEISRGRNGKMREQCGAIGPMFDEDEPELILAIHMDGMRDAAGLCAGAANVFQAEPADLVQRVLPRDCTAGYYDHGVFLNRFASSSDGVGDIVVRTEGHCS